MQLYHEGLTGKLAEYACKKFKSHRQIPRDDLIAFIKEKNCEKVIKSRHIVNNSQFVNIYCT